jgi:VanZ family protein
MAGIFFFSSRSRPLGPITGSQWEAMVGNLAHILEYAGLTALIHRAVAGRGTGSESPGVRESNASDKASASPITGSPSFVALLISFAYALSDEIHQVFVPGRAFELYDLALDLAGITIASALIWRIWSRGAGGKNG